MEQNAYRLNGIAALLECMGGVAARDEWPNDLEDSLAMLAGQIREIAGQMMEVCDD